MELLPSRPPDPLAAWTALRPNWAGLAGVAVLSLALLYAPKLVLAWLGLAVFVVAGCGAVFFWHVARRDKEAPSHTGAAPGPEPEEQSPPDPLPLRLRRAARLLSHADHPGAAEARGAVGEAAGRIVLVEEALHALLDGAPGAAEQARHVLATERPGQPTATPRQVPPG